MGESIAPYVVLDALQAVLPLSLSSGDIARDDHGYFGVDRLTLADRMRRRWRIINEVWDAQKGSNNKLSLLENLDYMGKLSGQLPRSLGAPVRVAYSAGGRPTASVVASQDAIIDCSLYWMGVQTQAEGDYVAAVINSAALEKAAAPLMSKGQFGARNMKKHLWRLPIPEYDDSDSLHVEIAQAGEDAAAGAKALWDEIRAEREGKGQSTSVTVARREIRAWLSVSEEGQRVEELVRRLLGNSSW